MAKDCLDHFEHAVDARNHPKIKALRASYGWEGVGRFWALNEIIGGTSNVRLDLSKKVYRATTAEDLGLSIQAFEEFLSFLCNPDECGLIKSTDGVVTTDKTTENWENLKAYRDREATRKALSRGKTPLSAGQAQMSSGLPTENAKNPADSRPSSVQFSSVQSLGEEPPIPPTTEKPSPVGLVLPDFDADGAFRRPSEITPLFTSVRNTFQTKGGVAWGKAELEVEALHWLEAEFRSIASREQREPEEVAQDILGRFWKMRETGRDFWKTQPYTPRRLQSVWEQLLTETSAKPAAAKFTAATFDPTKPSMTVEAM